MKIDQKAHKILLFRGHNSVQKKNKNKKSRCAKHFLVQPFTSSCSHLQTYYHNHCNIPESDFITYKIIYINTQHSE